MSHLFRGLRRAVLVLALACIPAAAQRIDQEYYQADQRISSGSSHHTELVDHNAVLGHGALAAQVLRANSRRPGELTYAKDIHRYYESLANASATSQVLEDWPEPRGPGQVVLAIADEKTLQQLDQYKPRSASARRSAKKPATSKPELIKTVNHLRQQRHHITETGVRKCCWSLPIG